MKPPRRDRGGWLHAITVVALISAITVVLVVFAPLDGVSDHVAAGQAVGAPDMDSSTGRRNSDLDTRLVLQLGMLFALLYVGFVCLWLSRTRGGAALGDAMERLRSRWSVALSNTRARLLGQPVRTAGSGPSMCSIAWKRGHHRSRFQAVISNPGDRRPRVVAESNGLPWPPKDARNPPTRELEAALASLVAKIVAAGWEPVQSDGSWTERRFVWRATNLVALDVGDAVAMPGERRVAPRRLPLAMAAVPVVVAALGGLLLAKAVDAGRNAAVRPGPAPPQALAHDGLRVQLPGGWAAAEAATVPGFSRPLGVGSPREQLSAVIERLPATSPTLLPAALVRAEAAAGAWPELVRLAPGQRGWRYRFLHADGSVRIVIAAPTTDGVATVACLRRAASGVPPGCQSLASAITVPGSRPLPPGASAAFLSRLRAAVSELEAARATGVKQLSGATRPGAQARAAAALARAHAAAAAALAPLASPGDAVSARTVVALSATATAYTTLAGAARAGAGGRYASAGRAISTAEANLHRAVAAAAAAANAASSAPVRQRASDTGTSLLVPLLGLLTAAGILGGILSATGVLRRG
jgi:hypothetical protein